MWKSKRNVRITYELLPPSTPACAADETDRLDDKVQYQGLTSNKIHTVHGIDKASSSAGQNDAWDWRGKGWLMIASSHWEVLGWGEEESDTEDRREWAVTYFAKTLFTPAGIDIYSRIKSGLKEETIQSIKSSLATLDVAEIVALAEDIFEIKTDAV